MSRRFSHLQPLTNEQLQFFTKEMLGFFAPTSNKMIRQFLSLPIEAGKTQPLSINDFLAYLDKASRIADPAKYFQHILVLAQKLSNHGILLSASPTRGSPGLNRCYYSMHELTTLQASGTFWLGSILGENYLREQLTDFIVRIEGINSKNIIGTGSGVLISENTILTCAHNIRDMEITSCWVGDNHLTIIEQQAHERYDLGIIKISPINTGKAHPYFGSPAVLDRTLTLGYPPLRGLREPLLLAQSGEINAVGTETFSGCECITISSITRPGNSGGPVFSMQGYIAGIVIEQATSAASFTVEEQDDISGMQKQPVESPFYLAISSTALKSIIPEIAPDVVIRFEDYQ